MRASNSRQAQRTRAFTEMKRKHKAAAPQSSDSTATLPASKKTTETVVATAPSADTSHIISKIEQDLQEAIFAVKDGTHAEVAKRSNNLLRIKDKRVATADRHRKLQIKNINELYDYEVQDSEALFQVQSLDPIHLLATRLTASNFH